jgi:hypothetical protein
MREISYRRLSILLYLSILQGLKYIDLLVNFGILEYKFIRDQIRTEYKDEGDIERFSENQIDLILEGSL